MKLKRNVITPSTNTLHRHGCMAIIGLTALLLTACGGGGGDGGSSADSGDDGGSDPIVTVSPAAPEVNLGYGIKQLRFSWAAVDGATYYQLQEDPDGSSGYTQVGGDITVTSYDHDIFLPQRLNARYIVNACNSVGCTESDIVYANSGERLREAIGYTKASNTDVEDYFGKAVSLSDDGNTLAVGAYGENSASGGEADDCALGKPVNCAPYSGAAYIFGRDSDGKWSQQAYLKAPTPKENDRFGFAMALSGDSNTLAVGAPGRDFDALSLDTGAVYLFTRDPVSGAWSQHSRQEPTLGTRDEAGRSVALSTDGRTLAIGAEYEDSKADTINGDEDDDSAASSGAVYILTLGDTGWVRQAYIKSSMNAAGDLFGRDVALSGDGNTLAVGAPRQDPLLQTNAGLVFIYSRDAAAWSEVNHIYAKNLGSGDTFGNSVALSADGKTLAVGSELEDSAATTIDGDDADNSADASGAAHIFVADAETGWADWSQQAYIKAFNAEAGDWFGSEVALSADGNILAVVSMNEGSVATSIHGDHTNNDALESGAVYLFSRDATTWSHKSYIKASNTDGSDYFGTAVAISANGDTLAVGSFLEDSNATGICASGDTACATAQSNNDATDAGAVYLY